MLCVFSCIKKEGLLKEGSLNQLLKQLGERTAFLKCVQSDSCRDDEKKVASSMNPLFSNNFHKDFFSQFTVHTVFHYEFKISIAHSSISISVCLLE